MRARINCQVKRWISICMVWILLLSMISPLSTTAYAAEDSFEKVTLSLDSNVVNDSSIDLYLYDSVYYISIDDLCLLTRCSQTFDGNVISVKQGFWSASFDIAAQTFDDIYQTVDISILKVSNGTYAVPALLFLSYYKAIAFIENNTLYCKMSAFTAWEALDVDFDNSLIDIYELYGGEGNVTLSLTLDIIMDFIMGDLSTSDGYVNDAFLSALEVNLYDYDSVKNYEEEIQNELYLDLHSDVDSTFLESLKDYLPIAAEPAEWYIQHYYNNIEKSFVSLAYDAYHAGRHTDVTRYGKKFYEALAQKNKTSQAAKKYFESMDYLMIFAATAAETARAMKYESATNSLVYDVMGQENLHYLGISADDNSWFTVADRYQNILGVSLTQLEAEAQKLFTDKLCWEKLIGISVSSAADIGDGVWSFALDVTRLIFSNSSSVRAFEADRRALYLSELQQNVYWVTYNTLLKILDQQDSTENYSKYIYALQLYCRTSIAMYENLIEMVNEFGKDSDYWSAIFQRRIDMLAVSLYQLTSIQDDGVNDCLPMDIASFQCENKPDAGIDYEMRTETIEFRLSDGTLYYSNTIKYPYFKGNSSLEADLNQRYADMISGSKANDTDYDALYQEQIDQGYHFFALPFYDNMSSEVVYNERGILSIKETYLIWSGGAHPYHYETGLNYELGTGNELTYLDILDGTPAQIDELLKSYFLKCVGNRPTDSQIESLKEYTAYTLRKDGLCFYYNRGDAVDRLEIVIPYSSDHTYIISVSSLLH